MPSGKSSKTVRTARPVVTAAKPKPWGTIAAVAAIVVFAAVIGGVLYVRYEDTRSFKPTAEVQDPSTRIPGIVIQDYSKLGRGHIEADKRVAYDHNPPFGGPHDGTWAACNGIVYTTPVRNENMVHALEHGAVWIAYNPDKIKDQGLQSLRDRVQGSNYLMLSPYPGLDAPISLQSWGHQLKLTDPADRRIDHFIQALRLNQYTYPEIGASCEVLPGLFDPAKPPPFVATPPGPDAIPLTYAGGRGTAPGAGATPTIPAPAPPSAPAGG
ncbi:MAG TPA: DUF3105 domain-containing protein [Pseudonocardiaceae bacterium]|nr:DUF3105 domain-containing protein [Pseudonocardiaceae bacterium]